MTIDLIIVLYMAACHAIGGLLLGLVCYWAARFLVGEILRRAVVPPEVSEKDIREEPDLGDYSDLSHSTGRT